MKRSNRLVILVGVLLAVLAFVGIVVVLNNQPSGGNGEEPTKVKVLVAARDLALGDEVTSDDVTVTEVEPADVVGTRIGDPSALPQRPLLYPISEGRQVSADAFGVSTTACIECQLEPGEKAIAFQVDRVTGLDFLVQPGDHVDIVLTEQVQVLQPTEESLTNPNPDLPPRFETIPGLENARTVKTILQDKRVLYVSARNQLVQPVPSASPGQGAQGEQATQQIENVIIVIAGTAQDAEVVKFAQNDINEIGSLTAILRRTADTEEGVPNEETTGITIDILFEQYGIPIPDIIIQLGPEASPSPAP